MSIVLEPLTNAVAGSLKSGYLPALQSIQKTLSITTGLSLAAVDFSGKILVSFAHPSDRIQGPIMEDSELIGSLLVSDSTGFRTLKCVGGLTFLSSPIIINAKLFGHILAGPVWEAPPTPEQMVELQHLLKWDRAEVMDAVLTHPAPVPIDLTTGEELATTLAELTAQIIHTEQQQYESIMTLRSLYDISTSISASLDISEILPTVLNSATSLLNAGSGSISLVDRNKGSLQIIYKESPTAELEYVNKIPLNEEISKWIASKGENRILDEDGKASAITVPLHIKETCIGSIKAGKRLDGPAYTSHDLQVLGIVAGHASSAIDKAQVYAQALRQFRELEALQEVGLSLNASVDVPKTLAQVLDHTCELLEAKTASVMLLEPDGKHLKIRVARGLSDEVVKSTRVKLGERISGKVALHGVPIQLSKGFGDKGEDMEASLCVPLKVDNKVIGVLNIRGHAGAEEFTIDDLNLATRLACMSAAAIENAELHDELQQLFVESITALANSIDARDPYTRGHSERVAEYSVLIAKKLNFSSEEQWQLRNAALLHDIGKIKIRDNILNKPDKLSDEEYEEMKRHPVYGAGIMMPVKTFRPLIPYILHHHERYDGKGYPDHKMGDEIPFCARIICVADSFDAMTSTRPYRKSMDIEQAVNIMQTNSGTQFDPYVVNVFLQIYHEGLLDPILHKIRTQAIVATAKPQNIISSESGGYAVVWRESNKPHAFPQGSGLHPAVSGDAPVA